MQTAGISFRRNKTSDAIKGKSESFEGMQVQAVEYEFPVWEAWDDFT